jgi:hypothetical protein
LRFPISCHQDTISRHDIVSFVPISDPILETSAPMSGQSWDIPVPCQTQYYQYRARYRFFPRYRLRYPVNIGTYPFLAKPDIGFFTDTVTVPDMIPILQKLSEYTDIGTKKPRCRSRCVCNIAYTDIAYFRYRVFFLILGTIYQLLRLRPLSAAQALRPLCKRSNWSSLLVLSSADQRGSALDTAYILAHSVLLQKKALVTWSRVVPTYSKLET